MCVCVGIRVSVFYCLTAIQQPSKDNHPPMRSYHYSPLPNSGFVPTWIIVSDLFQVAISHSVRYEYLWLLYAFHSGGFPKAFIG